jgi:hypothetical protein
MTKENAVTVKDTWTGEDKLVYVPNFDELVKNASCEEEVNAIRETEERMKSYKSIWQGFAFEIVFMSYERALGLNPETMKQEWTTKWQMMQFPWYRDGKGVYHTKEEMMAEVAKVCKSRQEG